MIQFPDPANPNDWPDGWFWTGWGWAPTPVPGPIGPPGERGPQGDEGPRGEPGEGGLQVLVEEAQPEVIDKALWWDPRAASVRSRLFIGYDERWVATDPIQDRGAGGSGPSAGVSTITAGQGINVSAPTGDVTISATQMPGVGLTQDQIQILNRLRIGPSSSSTTPNTLITSGSAEVEASFRAGSMFQSNVQDWTTPAGVHQGVPNIQWLIDHYQPIGAGADIGIEVSDVRPDPATKKLWWDTSEDAMHARLFISYTSPGQDTPQWVAADAIRDRDTLAQMQDWVENIWWEHESQYYFTKDEANSRFMLSTDTPPEGGGDLTPDDVTNIIGTWWSGVNVVSSLAASNGLTRTPASGIGSVTVSGPAWLGNRPTSPAGVFGINSNNNNWTQVYPMSGGTLGGNLSTNGSVSSVHNYAHQYNLQNPSASGLTQTSWANSGGTGLGQWSLCNIYSMNPNWAPILHRAIHWHGQWAGVEWMFADPGGSQGQFHFKNGGHIECSGDIFWGWTGSRRFQLSQELGNRITWGDLHNQKSVSSITGGDLVITTNDQRACGQVYFQRFGAIGSAANWQLGVFANRYGPVYMFINISEPSDEAIKENIAPSEVDGLSIINALELSKFDFTDEKYGGSNRIGLVAQNVEKHVPEAVFCPEEDNLKRINRDKLIPYLIRAIQQLSERINHV